MSKKHLNTKHYSTPDLGLAGYLLYNGVMLLGTVPTQDPKRLGIYFIDRDDRRELVTEYFEGRAMVDARRYARCIHTCAKELKNPVITKGAKDND